MFLKIFGLFTISGLALAGSAFTPQFAQTPIAVPIGAVLEYAGTNLPDGGQFDWADGGCISRTNFPTAFGIMGTIHGACDGSTTFAKPDRRGKFARGWVPASLMNLYTSATAATNKISIPGNTFRTGMKVRLLVGGLTGLTTNQDYYAVVDPTNQNLISFAATRAAAMPAVPTVVAISGTTTGYFSQFDDPDASARVAAATGGIEGNGVGGYQIDELRSHQHTFSMGNDPGGVPNSAFATNGGVNGNGNTYSGANPVRVTFTGGNDTRPLNIAMGYIVRVK